MEGTGANTNCSPSHIASRVSLAVPVCRFEFHDEDRIDAKWLTPEHT